MKRRLQSVGFVAMLAVLVAAAAWLLLPADLAILIGVGDWTLPTLSVVAVIFAAGVFGGAYALRTLQIGSGHDPKMLLPRLLSKKVKQAIDDGYRSGELENARTVVEHEAELAPNSLGLQYWRIRLLLDTGRSEQARRELVRLLALLPEVALTIRWSALYESAGEQEMWIRNVLDRIRDGQILRRSTFR